MQVKAEDRNEPQALRQSESVARFALFFEDDAEEEESPAPVGAIDLEPYRVAAAALARKRADYLADMARARVLDMSHKEERALRIMARHFGGEEVADPAA